jgi:adenosine kinase
VDGAKVFYAEGYFLTHGTEILVDLAKRVSSTGGKVFALNLSAPFIPTFFAASVQAILPYCDIVIANEAEAEAWASATGQPEQKDLAKIARTLADQPKSNPSRPRTVIFTHGAEATTIVVAGEPERIVPVHPLEESAIVDTNGAGDAFSGGFLGAYVKGVDLEGCVEAGHKLASISIQQVGPQYAWPKISIL